MKTFEKKPKMTTPPVRRGRTPVLPSFDPAAQSQRAQIRQVLRPPRVKAKLTIGQPNDKYEQEADRVADQVMRMPDPRLQRQVEPEEEETLQPKPLVSQITPLVQVQRQEEPEEEEEELQAKFADGSHVQRQEEEPEEEEEEPVQAKQVSTHIPTVTPNLASLIQSLKDYGRPLSRSVRGFFEPRFGYDFSRVRVHTDTHAARTSKALDARAFTLGRDVLFGEGQYAPGTPSGQRLLAHELSHVVQQTGDKIESNLSIGRASEKYEQETGRVEDEVIQNETLRRPSPMASGQNFSKLWTPFHGGGRIKGRVQRQAEGAAKLSEAEIYKLRMLESLARAGVKPEFPGIYNHVWNQARKLAEITWEEWRDMHRDPDVANEIIEKFLGKGVDEVVGKARDWLFRGLGLKAVPVIGLVCEVVPFVQDVHERNQWHQKDKEKKYKYRTEKIYYYLLQQLAHTLSKGNPIIKKEIFENLVHQTTAFEHWLKVGAKELGPAPGPRETVIRPL